MFVDFKAIIENLFLLAAMNQNGILKKYNTRERSRQMISAPAPLVDCSWLPFTHLLYFTAILTEYSKTIMDDTERKLSGNSGRSCSFT